MATTQNTYTGNGSTTDYSITFEYLKDADIKVTLDHVATTAFTLPSATTLRFTTAPGNNVAIRIFRDTDVDAARFIYSAGSAIKAAELNENADQALYGLQETANTDDITDAAVTTAKLRDGAVTSAKFANDAITTAKIADSAVTTAKIAADAVNGTKIADDSINSEHYVDGSIDTAHIADAQITTAKIADDAVTADKLANTAVTAGSYTAADITVDAQGRVTAASSGAIGTAEITDSAVTTAKIADANVTTAKIADSAVTTAKIADAELVELSTMGGNTASALADLTQAEVQILDGATVTTNELNILDGVTATASELNQLDGNTLKTTSTDFTSSSQFPSASEIDARITARIDPLGGFEAIADEDSFPATAPPVGTVISIANANGLAVNSSGVGAGTRAGGSDAVVINGFPSTFNSTSLDNGIGLLVIATSTAHTYDFHRVVAKNEDVRQLSSDINDFKARYRIGSSNPTTDNDAGDLFFNTGTNKMLVYNATNTAWEEVQSIGEFFINTISSSSGTGGGSATFNGSAYRFTLSNAPTNAQQLLVSINGVVQKPNSGTSQPSEGFALDGSDIILAAAPANGADFFIITIGSTVNIGTPSAGTVGTTQLADIGVTTAKLAADAVTGAKIADDSIDSEHYVDGSIDTAHIADANITTAKIADANITTAKIADDAVTAAKLADTAVTAGSYTLSSITVDAQGRITAASSGSAGDSDKIEEGNTNVECVDTGSDGHILFDTEGSERMRIDSSGNVGIGIASPSQKMHLEDSGSNVYLRVTETGNTGIDFGQATDGNGVINLRDSAAIQILTGNSERIRIDSSGRLLVGTTSADSNTRLHVSAAENTSDPMATDASIVIANTQNAGSNEAAALKFNVGNTNSASISAHYDSFNSGVNSSLRFYTQRQSAFNSPAERMRIASNGEQRHFGTNATNLNIANSASAGNSYEFLYCQHSSTGLANGTNSFRVSTNGNVTNTNNSYGAISDQNLKENIVNATSQWNDIKDLQVRKYNFRENTGHETYTQLGLIAQEAESVSPGLVRTTPVKEGETVLDADGNQLESIKSINYSVLYMKAVKALQEAMARIETLETQNASLEARLTALEGGS